MTESIKQRLRRLLLGRRFQDRLDQDRAALARLGNREYFSDPTREPGFTPGIEAFEHRCHSQNGEDGILLHLLSCTGVGQHRMVEIGTGDGRECNSANLVLNFGWRADLFEASAEDVAKARAYFDEADAGERVTVTRAAVTPGDIDRYVEQAGVPSDLDVLSIDVDSVDYWLWQALETTRPRLVVIEYNASLGPQRSLTVPQNFTPTPGLQSYHGASLAALTKLGEEKGYLLAGCESHGINAFFVREDLAAANGIEAVPVAEAFRPHYWRSKRWSLEQQYESVDGLPWVEV